MKIKIDIWKRNKISGFQTITHHMVLTDEDIEQLALEKYNQDYGANEECEYSARIDETII